MVCSNVLFSQGSLPPYAQRLVLVKTASLKYLNRVTGTKRKTLSPKGDFLLGSAQQCVQQGTLLDMQWLERNSQSASPSM